MPVETVKDHAPPHESAGTGALVATMLVAALVLASLLWLIKPWRKRSSLPRARAKWTEAPDDEQDAQ